MGDFRELSPTMLASPQIWPDEVATAAALGVRLIINNRPDGESPDEPQGPAIEAAARAAGVDYVAIPVSHAGFSLPQVEAMGEALANAGGKVLAYCRSGTRSTFLWAMAQAETGMEPDAIAAAAASAGYDITPVRPTVDMLAAQAKG